MSEGETNWKVLLMNCVSGWSKGNDVVTPMQVAMRALADDGVTQEARDDPDESTLHRMVSIWHSTWRMRLPHAAAVELANLLFETNPFRHPGQSLIISAERAKQPLASRHWSKDSLVPYTGCHCNTCTVARAAQQASAPQEDWRQHAANWLNAQAVEQENRHNLLRSLASDVLKKASDQTTLVETKDSQGPAC
jgi:hypothetical protein